MNRREVLTVAVPAVAAVTAVGLGVVSLETRKPAPPPEPELTAHKYVELPLQPGDEIVAMTMFRDELIVATKHGEIFRLRPSMFS